MEILVLGQGSFRAAEKVRDSGLGANTPCRKKYLEQRKYQNLPKETVRHDYILKCQIYALQNSINYRLQWRLRPKDMLIHYECPTMVHPTHYDVLASTFFTESFLPFSGLVFLIRFNASLFAVKSDVLKEKEFSEQKC